MALRLDDRWVWDFWLAEEAGVYHAFYLQAPRSLGDADLRHWHASIGHSVSEDLVTWSEVGVALEPGPAGAWDDVATWTGSVLFANDTWYMFYTGASSAEDGLIQRIGVALSDDLRSWTKHPDNPILEADPRWYELLDKSSWHDQAWRDPWVYQTTMGFEMVLTARSRSGNPDERGVIGLATSPDLVSWVAQPPLTMPGEFGHMEVPQRVEIDGHDTLLFSCAADQRAERRSSRGGETSGCYALVLDGGAAPHSTTTALALDTPGLYSCRAITDPAGNWVLLGFVRSDDTGAFAGHISDPVLLGDAAPTLFGHTELRRNKRT